MKKGKIITDTEASGAEGGKNRMSKEKDVTNEEAPPHTHTSVFEHSSPGDHSMRITPLNEDRIIPISQATLKLLDSFCGGKTYDEVITSLIQKELAEDES